MDTRIPSLDGLRAIAILLVMFTHLWTYPAGYVGINRIASSGWLGVDLFLVLSGFLITGILLRMRCNTAYFSTFYIRRSLRIFPAYYVLLTVVFFVLPHLKNMPLAVMRDAWAYWFYVSNFVLVGGWQLFLLDITWSLAIEEQFYLLWPALVRWTERLLPLCIGVIIAAPIVRFSLWQIGVPWTWLHMMMPLRMDAFACGALLVLRPRGLTYLSSLVIPIVLLDVSGNYARDSQLVNTVGYSLNALASTGVIALALRGGRFARTLEWRPIKYVGRISYGMYLYHPLCLMAASMAVPKWGSGWVGGVLQAGAVSALTVSVASVSFYLFEQPIGRLKKKFEPLNKRTVSGATISH